MLEELRLGVETDTSNDSTSKANLGVSDCALASVACLAQSESPILL